MISCQLDTAAGVGGLLLKAAGDHQGFASHVLGIRGGQVDGGGGDIVDLADAAERCLRNNSLFKISSQKTGGLDAFGDDHAGIDGVDADIACAEFLGKCCGDDIHCALGGRVDRGVGRRDVSDGGTNVNDTAAFGAEILESFL